MTSIRSLFASIELRSQAPKFRKILPSVVSDAHPPQSPLDKFTSVMVRSLKANSASGPISKPQSKSIPKDKGKSKNQHQKKKKPVSLIEVPSPAEISEDEADEEGLDDVSEEKENAHESNGSKASSNSGEDEDSEDEGVDEEGMERLIKLLGDDGLDDFDRAQLQELAGDSNSDEGDSDDEGERVSEEEEIAGASSAEEDEEDEEIVNDEAESDEEAEGKDDAVLLDEVESIDEDTVPQHKLEIDNQVALERIRRTIQLDPSLPWTETLVLTYPEKIEVDVDDDLNRELAFYKQALHSAQAARTLASECNFPFTRPSDYFAEMIKSDAHMERIRQRLLNEGATIKKSEEKRKEREGKKFGKQVQIEKLKEREKSKKEMNERLKNLKRKRKDMLDNAQGKNNDDFDVAVEDAISDRPSKRNRPSETGGKGQKARMPRQARDKKYGFGGAGRRSKQNTKESTDTFGSSTGRGKKGKGGAGAKTKTQRPGKSKRMAARHKS